MKLALVLLLAGLAGAAFGVPAVRQAVRRFLRHSAEQSPAALSRLGRSRWRCLAIVLWFASMTSLAEMAYLTYSKEITRYKIISFEFMWQVPAGYALIFAPIALLVLLPTRQSISLLVFLCSFVSVLALLPIAIGGLYYWAAAILAAGIGLQAVRGWRAHAWAASRITTVALPAAALVIGLAAVFAVRPIAAERRALAELPAVPAGPNIVLIVLDTVRARSLSLYRSARSTSPSLENFASKGLVFDRAYATSSWTLPSHGSMFTGRAPHELSGSFASPIDATHPTVAGILGKRGYLTAGFVANTWYGGSAWGLGRGFQHYDDAETSLFTVVNATSFGQNFIKALRIKERFSTHDNFGRKDAREINGAFLRWVERAEAVRPFFAFLNYCDAHGPYLPPAPFATRFTAEPSRAHINSRRLDAWTSEDVRGFNDAYDGAIAYLDSQLDVLFRAIESTPRLRNTLVIVTSDHGEQFGEHGLVEHVNSLYLPLLHVPLVIVGPGLTAGRRIPEPVSLRDIAATILQAAGVEGSNVPGQSLVSRAAAADTDDAALLLAEVEKATRGTYPEWYPAQRGRMKTLISRDWQYIRNFGDGKEELFDLRADPVGLTDRSMQEPARLNEYRSQLNAFVKPSAPSR